MSVEGIGASVMVMELLRQHVPLSLLLDLVDPRGPRSAEIYTTETRERAAGLVAAR